MKIQTTLMIAALALSGATGCKKKEKTPPADPTAGSGAMTKPTEGSAAVKPDEVKPLAGKDLAKIYTDCVAQVNDGKFDDFKKACLSDDYKGHEMDGAELPNADALLGFFNSMKAGFPDFKLTPQLVVVSGRNILGIVLISGTHTADWTAPDGKVIKKTDKKFGQLMLHRLAINDQNKANEEWAYSDPMTMMGQLGQLPKEVGPSRPAIEASWPGAPVILVTEDNAAEKANLDLVNKSNDLFNTHKIADISATFAADAVESDHASPKDAKGTKEIEAGLTMFITAFPDIKVETLHAYAAGDYVVTLGTGTGTNTGALGPMKATGKSVTMNYAELVKLKDGKITEMWRFRSGLAMAMQLGMMGDAPKGDAPGGDAPKDMKGGDMKDMHKDHK